MISILTRLVHRDATLKLKIFLVSPLFSPMSAYTVEDAAGRMTALDLETASCIDGIAVNHREAASQRRDSRAKAWVPCRMWAVCRRRILLNKIA